MKKGILLPYLLPLFLIALGSAPVCAKTGSSGIAASISEIQNDLAWLGIYNGLADGVFGNNTLNSIKEFQRLINEIADGALTESQEDKLRFEASKVRAKYGWTHFSHPYLEYSIGYPGKILTHTKALPNGGRQFFGVDNDYGLVIQIKPSSQSIEVMYRKELEKASVVKYSRLASDWFVVKSSHSTNEFYTRYDKLSDGYVGYTVMYPVEDAKGPLGVATAQSFTFSPGLTWNEARSIEEEYMTQLSKELALVEHSSKRSGDEDVVPSFVSSKYGSEKINKQKELQAVEIYRSARNSVYTVVAINGIDDKEPRQGTAVAIESQLLLTNCHIIDGKRIAFIVKEGDVQVLNRIILSEDGDMCLLYDNNGASDGVMPYRRRYSSIEIGEKVYAVGAPSGLDLTISDGIVSSKREFYGYKYIQTSAAISRGSSGGALIDRYGNLIGITSFFMIDSQNLNFAISVDDYFVEMEKYRER